MVSICGPNGHSFHSSLVDVQYGRGAAADLDKRDHSRSIGRTFRRPARCPLPALDAVSSREREREQTQEGHWRWKALAYSFFLAGFTILEGLVVSEGLVVTFVLVGVVVASVAVVRLHIVKFWVDCGCFVEILGGREAQTLPDRREACQKWHKIVTPAVARL